MRSESPGLHPPGETSIGEFIFHFSVFLRVSSFSSWCAALFRTNRTSLGTDSRRDPERLRACRLQSSKGVNYILGIYQCREVFDDGNRKTLYEWP